MGPASDLQLSISISGDPQHPKAACQGTSYSRLSKQRDGERAPHRKRSCPGREFLVPQSTPHRFPTAAGKLAPIQRSAITGLQR